MKNHLLAYRYADALRKSIEDDAQLDGAVAAMETVANIYLDVQDFRSAVTNPSIDKRKRVEVLHGVLEAEGISDPVRSLLDVLVRRGRIYILPEVAEVFGDLVDERLKRASARVKTAAPLSPEQHERLNKALCTYTDYDIRLKTTVDPKILGGVVVRIGGTVLDGSVRTRLNRLRETLLAEEGPVG